MPAFAKASQKHEITFISFAQLNEIIYIFFNWRAVMELGKISNKYPQIKKISHAPYLAWKKRIIIKLFIRNMTHIKKNMEKLLLFCIQVVKGLPYMYKIYILHIPVRATIIEAWVMKALGYPKYKLSSNLLWTN